VTGIIDLGEGDDIFNGGKHAEKIRDRDGTDTYNFGGGNDTYFAVYTSASPSNDGTDIVNGGAGIDTYDASALVNNGFITVNLDSVIHSGVNPHSVRLSAGGSAIGIDTVTGIEKFIGTNGFDVFWGSKGADIFQGGGAGDTIIGLGGADILIGGADNDSFLYTSLKDSGPTKATRDFIADFGFDDDLIDLQSINQDFGNTFHFVGNDVPFDGSLGAIIATDGSDEKTVVKLDVNGDKVADFSIGFNELLTFAASDFQL
jgi:Ca2+-binding RTX toxin-like protein